MLFRSPQRRRRYDRYRQLSRTTLPTDPEELWSAAGPSMIDPTAAAAVQVLRALTDLRVGDPIVELAPEPEVSPVRAEEIARPRAVEPRLAEVVPEVRRPEPEAVTIAVPPPAVVLPPPSIAPAPVRRADPRPTAAPTGGLTIDRSVAAEDLARLLDQYGPTGAFLKAARELRRTTLPQLSANTRISLRFLDALERDAYTDLPGATFVRGYLKMVIRALEAIASGDEAEEFIEGYMARFFRARG